MLTINLQGSAKGYLISSLVAWQRFVDVKHYSVSIYCKQLRFESRSFLKGHVLFLEIFLIQTLSLFYLLIVS